MENKIEHPTETTYFIAYDGNGGFSYGEVSPEQTMTTGLPNLWQTTNKTEWEEKLLNDFNITIEEQ